tara:strand:- start:2720 stop:2845 length:126 start_codon:yes stop_codon:yes gene_type:complete
MKNIIIEFTPFLGIGIGVSSRLNDKIIVILIPFISLEIIYK